MSTTLTNGLKLPDKGSVDWYADMQNNYQILDGAVGTVAEHTSQIAGKAPLVHTHGKADITDLFNSANTWTGRNTFAGIELSTTAEGKELLHNTWHGYEQYYTRGTSNYPNYDTFLKWNSTRYDNTLGLFKSVGVLTSTTEGATVDDIDETFAYYIYHINAKYADFMNNVRIVNDGTFNILAPITNATTDLGTSTNQWKSVYAQTYYYNGTAWGLDKANTWSALNCYRKGIWLDGARDAYIFPENAASYSGLTFATQAYIQSFKFGDFTTSNDEVSFNSSNAYLNIYAGYYSDGNKNRVEISPKNADEASLGTPTYKWKTLNGIDPGALSLPNLSDPDPIDTRNWVTSTPTNNAYTPSENGWLNVVVADISPSGNEFSLYVKSTNFFATAVHKLADIDDSKGKIGLFIPVMAGITYYVVVKGNVSNATISATFFPCLGNV